MAEPHLIIAAYWSTETPDKATEHAAAALKGLGIPGSGGIVSMKAKPDAPLRGFLRSVQLGEAAQVPSVGDSTGGETP
jgi:hypothetical protein